MEAEEEEEDYYLAKRRKPWPSSPSSTSSLLSLGKKVAIAGAAITSAPVVIPPLLLFSAIGLAFAFPFSVYFASYFCTDKLMHSLLPPPQEQEDIIIDGDQELGQQTGLGQDVEFGGEFVGLQVEEAKFDLVPIEESEEEDDGKQEDVIGEDLEIEVEVQPMEGSEMVEKEVEEKVEKKVEGEAGGKQEEVEEIGIEMWPPTVDERIVSEGDSIVPSISSGVGEEEDKEVETEERMGEIREEVAVRETEEEETRRGGVNEGKEVEENAIEAKTEHESSINDAEVGGEFARLEDEEIIGEVMDVEIEVEVQPIEGSEMVEKEVEEKVENLHGIVGGESRLSIDVSTSVENKGDEEIVEVISEAKPSKEEEKQQSKKQSQGIEFPQRNNVECDTAAERFIVEQDRYEKRIETVVLIETEEITGERVMRDEEKEENADDQSMLEQNEVETVELTETTEIADQRVLGDEGNEEDRDRPDTEELMTTCHSFVAANEIEPCTMSSDYASAIEDQLSEITDAESSTIAVVETVLLVHSDNEGFDSEERIWEQIYALRTIVGYKASAHSSLGDELRALYFFTGVEPPVSLKDTSDLAEVSDKLRFLKAVIGVK